METIRSGARVATWLELAVAPEWRRQACKVRLHPLGSHHACYAVTMDGRWLCAGDGRLTVLRGMESARHFLSMVRVEEFEAAEAAFDDTPCDKETFCLCVGRNRQLAPCASACRLDA